MKPAGEPSIALEFAGSEDGVETVTGSEISELVSGALQDAIWAAEQPCPATYLDILESRKRERMAQDLDRLPAVQSSHPAVHAELLAEAAMFRAQSQLAKAIVESLRDFAALKRRAIVAAMS